jgi:hypothetical protein
MGKSIKVRQKLRGRPATGRDPSVTVRIPQAVIDAIDKFGAAQGGALSRSMAIRKLIDDALKGLGYRKP